MLCNLELTLHWMRRPYHLCHQDFALVSFGHYLTFCRGCHLWFDASIIIHLFWPLFYREMMLLRRTYIKPFSISWQTYSFAIGMLPPFKNEVVSSCWKAKNSLFTFLMDAQVVLGFKNHTPFTQSHFGILWTVRPSYGCLMCTSEPRSKFKIRESYGKLLFSLYPILTF